MKIKSLFLALGVCLSILACNNAPQEEEVGALGTPSDSPLLASIANKEFEFRAGRAKVRDANLSMYSVDLFDKIPSSDICNYSPSSQDNYIMFSVNKTPGSYQLGFDTGQTITFWSGDLKKNLVATMGSIEISSATTQNVVGKLKAEYDITTSADGRFFVTVCP
jgi:hypothetical protein